MSLYKEWWWLYQGLWVYWTILVLYQEIISFTVLFSVKIYWIVCYNCCDYFVKFAVIISNNIYYSFQLHVRSTNTNMFAILWWREQTVDTFASVKQPEQTRMVLWSMYGKKWIVLLARNGIQRMALASVTTNTMSNAFNKRTWYLLWCCRCTPASLPHR